MPHSKRRIHANRITPARVFRVRPDPGAPFIVEVRIARSRRRMLDEMRRLDGAEDIEDECMGLVRSWHYPSLRGAARLRAGRMVARMYLNVPDLRERPSEIVAHECAHAGMAWARWRGVNIKDMKGEEVMCYAVGRLVKQINAIGYSMGVWA